MSGAEGAIIAAAISAAASLGGGYMANQAGAANVNANNNTALTIADANRRDQHYQYDETFRRNWAMDDKNKAFAQYMWGQQIDYNKQMANTAYARAMADMRAAGLNPMLAYQQGGAASPTSSPSVPSGSVSEPAPYSGQPSLEAFKPANILGPAASSAMQAAHMVTGLQNTQAQTELTKAETAATQAREKETRVNTLLRAAETGRANADTERLTNSAQVEAARVGLVGAQTGEAAASAGLHRDRSEQTRQEIDLTRRFGRPGIAGNAATTAEGVGRQLQEGIVGDAYRALQRGIGAGFNYPHLNWGSGRRHPPQAPNTPRGSTMDFMF